MSFRALNIESYFYVGWVLFSDSCGLCLIIYLASLTNQVNKSALRALEAISLYMHPASQQSLQINMDKIKFSAALEMYQELTYKKGILWLLITQWWISHVADRDGDQQGSFLPNYSTFYPDLMHILLNTPTRINSCKLFLFKANLDS